MPQPQYRQRRYLISAKKKKEGKKEGNLLLPPVYLNENENIRSGGQLRRKGIYYCFRMLELATL